jgi:hypothetical protein
LAFQNGSAEVKLGCDVCASSKWKSACPECNGTGKIIVDEKIKYWWSGDRKFFCILVNDGVSQATVSLTVEEAEALMSEVMQTPGFLALQNEAFSRALEKMTTSRHEPQVRQNPDGTTTWTDNAGSETR